MFAEMIHIDTDVQVPFVLHFSLFTYGKLERENESIQYREINVMIQNARFSSERCNFTYKMNFLDRISKLLAILIILQN